MNGDHYTDYPADASHPEKLKCFTWEEKPIGFQVDDGFGHTLKVQLNRQDAKELVRILQAQIPTQV